jgi:hypothetical protein
MKIRQRTQEYQARHHGSVMNVAMAAFVGTLFATEALAAEVAVRELQAGKYEIVLSSDKALSEDDARAQVGSVAAAVCKDFVPVFGKYAFDSKEPIGRGGSVSRDPQAYRFVQELSCVPGMRTPSVERLPTLKNEEERRRVQDEVRLKAEKYFRDIASK